MFLFVNLEINQLPDEHFNKLIEDPRLSSYKHYLIKTRALKPYQLSEEVEQMMSQKDLTGKQAFYNLYSELTADYKFTLEIDGEEKELSTPEIRILFRDPVESTRKKAFEAYYQKYEDNEKILTACFNNILTSHATDAKARNYPYPEIGAHIYNEVSKEMIDTMLEVTKENYHLVQDYYRLKARIMGKEKAMGHDIMAPLGLKEISKKFTWKQAKQMVLDTFYSFDGEAGDHARTVFEQELVHAEPRAGKLTGAFCIITPPEDPPAIMMSYTGNVNDLSSLAHEMGHAVHGMFSGADNTFLNFLTQLVLAETASIFGQAILTENIMKELDQKEKIELLAHEIEDFIASVDRQVMYTFFEKEIHGKIKERKMQSKEFCEAWNKHVVDLYGDSVEFLPIQKWNWISIPHFLFVSPFYVYAYAFGQLFVLALYQKYLKEGKEFVPKYKRLLSAGGSKSPVEATSEIGIDITTKEFWQNSFDYFKTRVELLEKLVDELE